MFIRSLSIKSIFLIAVTSFVLLGCSDDESSRKRNSIVQKSIQKYAKDTILKGKVNTKKGSIKEGEIVAKDSTGKVVATTTLGGKSHYSITIPKGVALPMVLTFTPSADSEHKKQLSVAAIYTAIKKYDINDLTTLITKKAKSLGGYNHANMSIAADQTVGIPDANKTSTGFRGDPTKQYGGWH
jgi:hypothetical protein